MAKIKRTGKAGDDQTTSAIQDISHVELPKNTPKEENVTEVEILTIDQHIANEVAKFNLPRAAIAKMKEQYGPLANINEDDKAGYKSLVAAIADYRGKRVAVTKKYPELAEDARKLVDGLRKERDELVEALQEGEEPLKKRKEEIDTAEERRKEAANRLLEEKLQRRVVTLLENGMGFNGSYYAIGDTISMDVVTLKNMEDAAFQDFLARVVKENEKIVADKEEADRLQAEKERLQEEQHQQQQTEARRLKHEREELDRQRREMEEEKNNLKRQLAEGRRTLLAQHGFELKSNGNMHIQLQTGTETCAGVIVEAEKIENATGKDWDEMYDFAIKSAALVIADNKKYLADLEEKKRQRLQREEEERQAQETLKQLIHTRATELYQRFGMLKDEKQAAFIRKFNHLTGFMSLSVMEVSTCEELEWVHHTKVLDIEFSAYQKESTKEAQRIIDEQAEADRLEREAAEADRQLKLGDAEKLWEYVKAIRAMKLPIIKDKDLRYKLSCFMSAVEELESNIDAVPTKAVN